MTASYRPNPEHSLKQRDETAETVAIATILTMVKKLYQA